MMWVSSTMDTNRQERKWLVVECKTLKCVKANYVLPPKMITLMGSHGRWNDYDIAFTIMMIIKHEKQKCI
jgi:hypothetical protein